MQLLKLHLFFILVSFFNSSFAVDEQTILPPEQAYRATAVIDGDNINITYAIEDGYYLYRSKFKFDTEDKDITLLEPQIPQGVKKEDEFFGLISVFRKEVVIKIPYQSAPDKNFILQATSQGCADVGICFPPFTQKITLKTKNADTNYKTNNSAPGFLLQDNVLSATNDDILSPEQAFIISTHNKEGSLQISFDIKPGYYLYKDKFKLEKISGKKIKFGKIKFNKAKLKKDKFTEKGEAFVFYNLATLNVPLQGDDDKTTFKISYQGCAEDKICYPPQSKVFTLNLKTSQNVISSATKEEKPAVANVVISEQDKLLNMIGSSNIFWTILVFFGLGLLLTFTPCVLPMVPILSNIIMGQKSISTPKAFSLSLIYVLAMALTYTILGVIIGLTGSNIQAALQNPYVISSFVIILVLLSLSMFGFYELQMPGFIQNKVNQISNKQQGGSFVGVAIMGFLSALIVGPCVTAPLVGVLMYIAQTGDGFIGGVILFSLSIGMGTPLIIIGSSAGVLLPKAGGWMDTIKSIFGVMLIATAIWMLDRVIPFFITMMLVAALAIGVAYFAGLFDSKNKEKTFRTTLFDIFKLVLFLYGIVLLIGALMGGNSLISPIPKDTQETQQPHLSFKKIKNLAELKKELNLAKENSQKVMFDFYADWCVSCIEMEKLTFSDSVVISSLKDVKLLQADVTANNKDDQELLKYFEIFGPPAIIFYNKEGVTNKQQRVVGFMSAEDFVKHIKQVF
jgi:thioredoxin:protein disulfide reductase